MDKTHFNGKPIGGQIEHDQGYIMRYAPWHPRAHEKFVYEHILVIEQALGKYLPSSAVVHHIDGNEANNEPSNLVVCEDQAYHKLLHRRQEALEKTGNSDSRKCSFCKKWDDPNNLYVNDKHNITKHRECAAKYANERYDSERRRKRYERTGH